MEKSGFNIPWASLAVLVAFVSSVLLPQRAFEPLRPAEKDSAQSARPAELEVEARLWEDPFRAMRRHESERSARCAKVAPTAKAVPAECDEVSLAAGRMPTALWKRLDRNGDGDRSDTLVVAALVPGNPFVGAEESRRRTRYALLAGFHAKEYVPDNAERVGIAHFAWKPASGEASLAEQSLDVPYEMLSQRALLRGETTLSERRYAQIALLWIDESALPAPKLDNLARTLGQLFVLGATKAPRLALIGPSSSDALRVALEDLALAAARPPTDSVVLEGYMRIAGADILSPFSTAPSAQFEVLKGRHVDAFVAERLREITKQPEGAASPFLRTIAPDNVVLPGLVRELRLRLPAGVKRRIVLVAERDSLYAQGLVTELKYRMRDSERLNFEVQYFFRGIDGVTTRESAEATPKDKAAPSDTAIEWPESRDQLDYLRRMAASLKASEGEAGKGPIGAIGILGHDVHDKLLVLQALHETFSDKVFFTTDMDARYLHPRTKSFTRNLVVASSLPLEFAPELQAGVPPLRDVYQAATYLAARRAACRGEACKDKEDGHAAEVLKSPSVYEIGRSGAVPVAGYDHAAHQAASNVSRATVAAAFVTLLALALLVWPSTPALRQARIPVLRWQERSAEGEPDARSARQGDAAAPRDERTVELPIALLVALHMSLLAFSVGSAIEFTRAGSLGVGGVVSLATVVGLAALFACYPRGSGQEPRQRHGFAWLLLIGVAGVLVWLVFSALRQTNCVDCEPVAWFEGVSAWPSHLFHLLALFAIAIAFDWLWRHALASMTVDAAWLALPLGPNEVMRASSWRRGRWAWFRNNTLACWRPRACRGVEFVGLWRQYTRRGRTAARVVRVLAWYVVTVAVIAVLFVAFSDGYVPEIPVRGADHRRLVAWTLYAALLLLPLLTVAVADATMLACHFIHHLNRCRTLYPSETLTRFAQSLGLDRQQMWDAPIAAEPADRALAGPLALCDQHSLLDDWIDVQVVARRTDQVAPLVLGPFCVLALLVVARSRLFDNWAVTLPIAFAAGSYLAWLVALSVLLKYAAERMRSRALERMNADLRWLGGVAGGAMVVPFERLIKSVESNESGAFAPFFEQPFVRALLVPLGGAGGAQLFDQFLLGR